VFSYSRERRLLASRPSVCLCVCPRVSARLLLDGFAWNLVLGTSVKIFQETPALVKKRTKFLDILHEDRSLFHFCRRHKFATTTLLCNYFFLLTKTCSSTIPREGIVAFPLQQWLLERATVLHYTYIAYFIEFFRTGFSKTCILSSAYHCKIGRLYSMWCSYIPILVAK